MCALIKFIAQLLKNPWDSYTLHVLPYVFSKMNRSSLDGFHFIKPQFLEKLLLIVHGPGPKFYKMCIKLVANAIIHFWKAYNMNFWKIDDSPVNCTAYAQKKPFPWQPLRK